MTTTIATPRQSMLHDWLVFPGAFLPRVPSALRTAPWADELVLAGTRGDRVPALVAQAAATAAPAGIAIYLHGNGETIHGCAAPIRLLQQAGFDVVAAEYAGYGTRAGRPSEAGCMDAAYAAYEYAASLPGFPRIVAAGYSLGSGVAFRLASERPVAGLVTFAAFTSLLAAGRHRYPFLPVHRMLVTSFDNEGLAPSIRCPVLLAHGDADRAVPAAMSSRLADVLPGGAATCFVPGAGHNDLFSVGASALAAALGGFVRAIGREPGDRAQ